MLAASLPRIALIASAILLRGAHGKVDEWYYECDGGAGNCGYSGKDGRATSCSDDHESCGDFALRGECLANPDWMHENCRRSCGLCSLDEIDDDEDCNDMHSNCPTWASRMECFTNPAYMSRACPKSW